MASTLLSPQDFKRWHHGERDAVKREYVARYGKNCVLRGPNGMVLPAGQTRFTPAEIEELVNGAPIPTRYQGPMLCTLEGDIVRAATADEIKDSEAAQAKGGLPEVTIGDQTFLVISEVESEPPAKPENELPSPSLTLAPKTEYEKPKLEEIKGPNDRMAARFLHLTHVIEKLNQSVTELTDVATQLRDELAARRTAYEKDPGMP